MRGKRQNSPSTKARLLLTGLVGLSLLLNAYLAAHLLNRKSAPPAAAETVADSKPAGTQSPSAAGERPEVLVAASSDAPTFRWSEIESADYRQYVANLRALGVSEQIIRDIILADVGQHFSKRAREIWSMRVNEYWKKYNNEQPNPKQQEQLMALSKEHGGVLKELLGVRIGHQELIDALYLQVHGSERECLLLPPEKRAAALQVLADADFESKEMQLQSQGDYYGNQQKLFDEKLKLLTDVLTPEELDEFHQRNSPRGSILKSEVRYLNLTPEEYRQLLFAKEASSGAQNTKELVKKLFGDERAKEFEQVSSAFYLNARTGAEAEGVALERVAQAAKFANDSMTTGLATAQDKTLSIAERQARLEELQSQAETRIKELLGAKASKAVLRDLRNVLRSSSSQIQP